MKKSSLIVFLTIFLSFSTAQPISEKTAEFVSVAGGTIIGGISGITTYALLANDTPKNVNIPLSALVALGAGGVSWWCLSNFLFQFTPQGKYLQTAAIVQKATRIVRSVELDSLLQNNFDCGLDVIGHINIKFGTNWPLVLARRHLNHLVSELTGAYETFTEVMDNIHRDQNKNNPDLYERYNALYNKCNDCYNKIPIIIITIEELMKPIVGHENFHHQTKLYENHQEAERQRQFEREKQQRELNQKQRELNDQRLEKQRDRELKQNVLQTGNHQVVVNI